MSWNDRAISWALALSLATAIPATLTPLAGAAAKTADQSCSQNERAVFLGDKPLQVNPGGKCPFVRIKLIVELLDPTSKPAQICLFARAVGSAKQYGPFCTEGSNF